MVAWLVKRVRTGSHNTRERCCETHPVKMVIAATPNKSNATVGDDHPAFREGQPNRSGADPTKHTRAILR